MTRTTDELLPPIAYATPNWLTQQSAWVMHIPFAFTLVDALRPRTVVELGVHAGDSYAAWCQAVDALALESRCYGIDTWEGDAHAGAYDGPALLNAFRGHHDPRYGRFSQLLRTTFDQALEHVDDASIDLLHIDGFHTYDAVSHDFESWSPKLSDRAVVLFHDTNVREADFGVHRYWFEIKNRYPSMEFLFGHGLGVIGAGSDLPEPVRALFDLGEGDRENLNRMLAALGERACLLSGYRRIDEFANRLGWSVEFEYFGHSIARGVDGLQSELETERSTRTNLQINERRLDDEIFDLRKQLKIAMRSRDEAHQRIDDFTRSTSWRLTSPLRRARNRGGKGETAPPDGADEGPHIHGGISSAASTPHNISDDDYARWFARYGCPEHLLRVSDRVRASGPVISVVMPVYQPDHALLRRAVSSVQAQTYPHWELCIADDASPDPSVRDVLSELQASDERIRVVLRSENGHISACSNSALEMATGDYVALLDQDDELSPVALGAVATEIVDRPDIDILYSDEDKIDGDGRHYGPFFKPAFDPVLLMGQNYVNHLSVYRRDLMLRVGGFREGFEGSQDHDLLLRSLLETSRGRVRHVPHVLYHWRAVAGSTAASSDEKPYAADAARRAIADYAERAGIEGIVEPREDGYQAFRPRLSEYPHVTIVVPTRNGDDILVTCISSIDALTTYPSYDIIVVDNGSDDSSTLDYLDGLDERDDVTLIRDDGPFSYSRLNNRAVEEATGEFVVLLNDDTEIVTPDWLEELVGWGSQVDVGSVGCKLLYPDGTVQHAGVVVGLGGSAGHTFKGVARDDGIHFGHLNLPREVQCSTAACLLVRRDLFLAVGGFDEVNLPVAFNDVDLGLRLREAGFRNIWTPNAVLIHHESKTRGTDQRPSRLEGFRRESDYLRARWSDLIDRGGDDYYNPNFSLTPPGHALAFPPRDRVAR